MSEYWVSHKKYFCKYCNIYIADDAPSRNHHESGMRHKGNVERFVRGLYKGGEKRKQDLEEEKREMARIEKAAAASFAQDVGSGLVKPGSSSTAIAAAPKAAEPSKPASKPSDPYANYSTASSLGFTDPDAERMKAEAERRMKEGVVGAWEFVAVDESSTSVGAEGEAEGETSGEGQDAVQKRKLEEAQLDDDDTRNFKLRKKKMNVGLGEIYDPAVIPIKLKAKKEEPAQESLLSSGASSSSITPGTGLPAPTPLPKWTPKGWNKPGAASETAEQEQDPVTGPSSDPKTEEAVETAPPSIKTEAPEIKAEESIEVKPEETDSTVPTSSGGSFFRKRKAPVGGRGRRPI